MTYELFSDFGGYKINVVLFLLNNTPFSDEKFGFVSSTTILVRLSVPLNESARMVNTEAGIVIVVNLEHNQKAVDSIIVTVFGIVTLVKLPQFLKVSMLIVVIFGTVTLVNPVEANAPTFMVVTAVGIVALVNFKHPENALVPIVLTELGITMLVKPEYIKALSLIVRRLMFCENVHVTILLQLLNANVPIVVTKLGMLILFIIEQLLNAYVPIVVSELVSLMVTVSIE